MGERNCNFIVTQVVASCSQIFSEQEGAAFMADLLVALPDQIKYIIVDRYYNFCSAKLSRTHHNFYSTLAKVSYIVEMLLTSGRGYVSSR